MHSDRPPEELAAKANLAEGPGCLGSERHQYVYVVNFRCGSTTIRHSLVQFEQTGRVKSQRMDESPRAAAKDQFVDVFRGVESARRFLADSVFWFSMVRHPATRLASAYSSKVMTGRPQSAPIHKRFGDGPISFPKFLDYLETVDLRRADPHWRMQYNTLMMDDVRLDRIARFEKYESDFAEILERLGAKVRGIPQFAHGRHTQQVLSEMTKADYARIRRLYDADFTAFGYDERPG